MENGVWVYAENDGTTIADVSLELLGKGRELADRLTCELAAFIIGEGVSVLAPRLIHYGADKVYVAEHPQLEHYLTLPYARIAVELIEKYHPSILLIGATNQGRDLAPRISSRMRTGLTADCTDLQIGNYRLGKKRWDRLLLQIRPAYGGNVIGTIVTPEKRPQMATVRERVMVPLDPDYARKGEIIKEPVELTAEDLVIRVVERIKTEQGNNLKAARIIVAGGMGVGTRENFKIIKALARTLGGEVGATRAAVDAGFVERNCQIGQTGVTVRPNLYIACGVSGAIQHRAGMEQSKRIIAINTDPQAPIFSIAHYGIVGDLHETVPRMIRAYKEKT